MKKNTALANLQFLLSIMVVLIHSQTVFINLPGKELQSVYGWNASTFIQMFISEGICRIAVPLFFVLSGYFFYRTFDGSLTNYGIKLKRRLHTLLIPYIFWGAVVFFFFAYATHLPGLKAFFTTRNSGVFSLKEMWNGIIVSPYNSPLWYVKYLLVFSALAIVLYPLYKKFHLLVIGIAFYGWIAGMPFAVPFRMDAIFFYSLGSVIALHWSKIRQWMLYLCYPNSKYLLILSFLWMIINILHAICLCRLSPNVLLLGEFDRTHHWLGVVGILTGCLAVIPLALKIDHNHEWNVSRSSFLLFVCHHPVVNAFKKVILKVLGVSPMTCLGTYFISATITIIAICFVGSLFIRFCPTGYRIVAGNRA